ncbi:MAG TPA: hypothetical protein VGF22_01590 [Acidimicrobiales bacterium]
MGRLTGSVVRQELETGMDPLMSVGLTGAHVALAIGWFSRRAAR